MKSILFAGFICLLCNSLVAQTYIVSDDSLANSPNPGKYFVQFLKGASAEDPNDTLEDSERKQLMRSLSFRMDRIPATNR